MAILFSLLICGILFVICLFNTPIFVTLLPAIRLVLTQTVGLRTDISGLGSINPSELFGIFLMGALVFIILKNIPHVIGNNFILRTVAIAIAFFTWGVLVGTLSIDGQTVVNTIKITSWLLLIPATAITVQSREHIRWIWMSGFIGVFICAIIVILSTTLGIGKDVGSWYLTDDDRISSVISIGYFYHPAELSLALGMSMMLTLLNHKAGEITERMTPIWIFTLLCGFYIMLAAGVRTPLLAVAVGLIFCSINDKSYKVNKYDIVFKGIMATILFTCLIAFYIYKNHQFIERRFLDVQETISTGNARSLGSGRVYLLEKYSNLVLSRDIIYLATGIEMLGQTKSQKRLVVGAHNDILDLFFQYGIVGLAIYISFFLNIAFRIHAYSKHVSNMLQQNVLAIGRTLLVMYCILIFHGMMSYQYPSTCFAVLLGLAVGPLGEGVCRTETSREDLSAYENTCS